MCVSQVQMERLLAKQMEILHDAAAQDRLQALEWRVPPGAFKHHADSHNANGVQSSAEKHAEQQGQSHTPLLIHLIIQGFFPQQHLQSPLRVKFFF